MVGPPNNEKITILVPPLTDLYSKQNQINLKLCPLPKPRALYFRIQIQSYSGYLLLTILV